MQRQDKNNHGSALDMLRRASRRGAMQIRSLWRDLRQDTRGNVLVLTALAAPVLFGAGALAIDLSHLYAVRSRLQTATDAGAFAGAQGLSDASTYSKACARARDYAIANLEDRDTQGRLGPLDVELGLWTGTTFQPISACTFFADGSAPNVAVSRSPLPNAVRVTAARSDQAGNPVDLTLARVLDRRVADVRARAVAAVSGSASTRSCLIARDGEFRINGNDTIETPNCGIGVDGELNVNGNAPATKEVSSLTFQRYDGGTGNAGPGDDFSVPDGQIFRKGEGSDTFSNVPDPDGTARDIESVSDCDIGKTEKNKGPATYKVKGACTLSPGVYRVAGNLQITGNASLDTGGGTAPAQIIVDGSIKFSGTPDFTGGCLQFNARSIRFDGNVSLRNDCDPKQPRPFPGDSGQSVSLVQ